MDEKQMNNTDNLPTREQAREAKLEIDNLWALNNIAPRTENKSLLNVKLDKRLESLKYVREILTAYATGELVEPLSEGEILKIIQGVAWKHPNSVAKHYNIHYGLFHEEIASALVGRVGKSEREKDLIETCTQCGGIGRTPNHPHIEAKRCQRCGGSGKINRGKVGGKQEKCPRCGGNSFRIYKEHIAINEFQCCKCQNIFEPNETGKVGKKMERNKLKIEINRVLDCYGNYEARNETVDALLAKMEE